MLKIVPKKLHKSQSNKIVVEKSAPVRTAEKIKEILTVNANSGVKFEVLSNPEFLAGELLFKIYLNLIEY